MFYPAKQRGECGKATDTLRGAVMELIAFCGDSHHGVDSILRGMGVFIAVLSGKCVGQFRTCPALSVIPGGQDTPYAESGDVFPVAFLQRFVKLNHREC